MRDSVRTMATRFPVLVNAVLLPALKPLRRLAYRIYPKAAHAVAGRFYVRGDIANARMELAAAGIAGTIAKKISEIDQIVASSCFPCPATPRSLEQAQSSTRDDAISVIHALHNALPLDQAGYALRSQGLLTAQTSQGIKVHPHTRPGYPHDLGRSKDAGCIETTMVEGVQYHHIDPHSILRHTGTEKSYITHYATELARSASTYQAQVIHGHSNYLNGLAAAWAANWSGRKSVYEARGLWHITRASLELAFKQSPLFDFQHILELEAMRQVDAVVALSSPMKQWMISHGIDAHKIHIIGNAIDVHSFDLPPRNHALVRQYGLTGKIVVGYAGSLVAYEGLELLIKAVERCLCNSLDIALVIVGDGPQKNDLEKLAKKLSITGQVHFTGHVPPKEIPNLLSLFDICPLPRLDLPVCNLVPPLKPLEIMAAEKPLIVSALPPLLEFGIENESRLSFKADNMGALAAVLQKLTLNDPLRQQLGKQARQWVEKNGRWQQNAAKYKTLYEGLWHC